MKSGVFETQSFQDCPTEPIISVKEFAFGSPKFFPTEKTSPNPNIKLNSVPNLVGGEKLNKMEESKWKTF